ncbi:hypothetical protein S7711_05886 [Stachybotrys chartarum IBT 7711]|uniref:Biotin and thiamin synthesis-associated domain-containing protein n=1 Tax=Stachybotrys chartarum (strain CBS 109288 / IBT 7711) TaxID=1280523 RepID=A0A084B164_STACB|nr:hypothetical protein S7711_05886 [Stachybotrys chartarum IBT 7711]KFA51573.1 hypothetical protein S40293_03944 [Stachybotrys chartarum IBT 40293]
MIPADLEQNGIYIQEGPVEVRLLPSHIISLRRALLDFDCTISDRLGVSNDDELNRFDTILTGLYASSEERGFVVEFIQNLREMKSKATKLYKGKDREREWECFFRDYFFRPLVNKVAISDDDVRQTSRTKFYYDYFEHAQSRPWGLFGSHEMFRHADRLHLTEPRPDWVAFYPIYNLGAGEAADRIPMTERWQWEKSAQDTIVENLSLKTLAYLSKYGLRATTASIFREGKTKDIDASDYICFPWFIVEHKKTDQTVETQCYCQAANAGAAALLMLQTLVKYAETRNEDAHIPPVVTMTTVGETVRIWITYSADKMSKFKMDCIWVGNMTTMVDMINLQAILENLHTWAMRVLRPWISLCIDHWKHRFPQQPEVALDPDVKDRAGTLENDVSTPVATLVSSSDVSDAKYDAKSTQRQARDSHGPVFEEILRAELELLQTRIEQSLKANARSDEKTRAHVEYRSIGAQTDYRSASGEDELKHTQYESVGVQTSTRIPKVRRVGADRSGPLRTDSLPVDLQTGPLRDDESKHESIYHQRLPVRPVTKLRGVDIFKTGITLTSTRGKRIPVKLPDLSSSRMMVHLPKRDAMSDVLTSTTRRDIHERPGGQSIWTRIHNKTSQFTLKDYEGHQFDFTPPTTIEWRPIVSSQGASALPRALGDPKLSLLGIVETSTKPNTNSNSGSKELPNAQPPHLKVERVGGKERGTYAAIQSPRSFDLFLGEQLDRRHQLAQEKGGNHDEAEPAPEDDEESPYTIDQVWLIILESIIHIATRRKIISDEKQALCFTAGANAIFTVEKMLTTEWNGWDKDAALFGR